MTAAIDHQARQAVIVMEETLGEVIEAVAKLAANTREADNNVAEVMADGFRKIGERLQALSDRVGMLELDHKRGE